MIQTDITVELIMQQVHPLSPEARVRLIQQIAATLLEPYTPPEHRQLIRGEFSKGRLSTEVDFAFGASSLTLEDGGTTTHAG